MTSTFLRRLITLMLCLMLISEAKAQEYLYEIGGMLGSSFYMGDANKTTLFKNMHPAGGAVFRYNANFRWALKADLLYGHVSGSTEGLENVFPNGAQASFDRSFVELGGQAEFNFFPYSDKFAYANARRFSPYLLLGLGITVAPGNGKTFASLNIPIGAGLKYKVKNRVNLGVEFSVRKLFGDGLDTTKDNQLLDNPYKINGSQLKNKDWYSMLLFSVTWDFGPRKRPCNSNNSNSAIREN